MQVTDGNGNIFGPKGLQVNGPDGKPKVISSGGGGGSIPHGIATGTDIYSVSITGVTSYADGDAYLVRFTNGNTTVSTLDINGIGAISLYRNNDGELIGGDIEDGAEMLCVYNSTLNVFQVIGTSPNTLLAYVTNAESIIITKGQPVYAFGGQGDRLKVKLAYNTSDATSAQTVGLVLSASIGANQKGFIILNGQLDGLSILPTSTWADGDPVYLGATAGTITNVKPSAPNHLVYLGFVTTANNGSAGRMYVRVQNGYEMDELHDVQISSLADNDIIQYDLAADLWQNKSLSGAGIASTGAVTGTGITMSTARILGRSTAGTGAIEEITIGTGLTLSAGTLTASGGGLTVGTTAIASGTVGRVLFEGAGNVLQQSASLFWDNTNNRLGIGTASPSAILHTVGSITASGGNARGNYMQPTLVAAANNDTVVGLDIDPTFTNGAFTGVNNLGLRVTGKTSITGSTTTTANNQGYLSFNPNITARATSSDNIFGAQFYPTITPSAPTQQMIGVDISPTLNGVAGQNYSWTSLRVRNGNSLGNILQLLNSSGSPVLTVNNSGAISAGGWTGPFSNSAQLTSNGSFLIASTLNLSNPTSGNVYSYILNAVNGGFNPSSGNANYYSSYLTPQISQSGTASGTIYGIYYNPTLTGLLGSHIAIQTVTGNVLLGTTSGNVLIGTTTNAGYKLDVNGTARFSGAITCGEINLSGQLLYTNKNSAPNSYLYSASNITILNGTFIRLSGGPVCVNESGANATASSVLDVQSTTKGFLPPRMTNAQMLAIAAPAAGLVVYDTTNNKHCGYNGTAWQNFY